MLIGMKMRSLSKRGTVLYICRTGTIVLMCASGAISNFHVLSGNRLTYLRGLYLIGIKLSFSSSGSSGLEMSRDNLIYVFCNLFKFLYMFFLGFQAIPGNALLYQNAESLHKLGAWLLLIINSVIGLVWEDF